MDIPTRLRVIGQDYTVAAVDRRLDAHMDGLYGYHSEHHLRIAIGADESPGHQKLTMIHEILHALEDALGTQLDEGVVDRFSHGLYAVLRDNPELSPWLMEEF